MGGRGSAGRRRVDHDSPRAVPIEEDPLLPPDEPKTSEEPPTEQVGGLESRIRDAYKELAVETQDWIRLSKLREKLGNPEPAEMDRILLAMARTGRVHLAPQSNRRGLTDADHSAAIRIGSEYKHLVAIEFDDDVDY